MNKHSTISMIAHGLVLCIALSAYQHMTAQYPFYFIFDMDLTTTLDLLLIQGNQIPVHINHPGFGMYFLLSIVHKVGYFFHWVSLYDLGDVKASLQPIVGIAQLIDFFRSASPWVCILIILSSWATVAFWVEKKTQSFLILILLSTQCSLLYQATMIRSELYAILFWTFSLLSLSLAIKTQNKKYKSMLIITTGIMAGVSYLTKLQALFYFASLPIFYFLLQEIKTIGEPNLNHTQEKHWFKKISTWNFTLFTAIMIGAIGRNAEGMSFTNNYFLNIFGALFWFTYLFLFLYEHGWFKKIKLNYAPDFTLIHLFALGFVASFLLHFLMYLNPAISLKYLLMDAKMLFYRNNYYGNYSEINILFQYILNFYQAALEMAVSYLVHIIVFILLLIKSNSTKVKLLAAVLFVLNIFNLAFSVRGTLRDYIWIEILLNLSTLIYIVYVFSGTRVFILRAVFLIAIIFGNFYNISWIRVKTDALYNHYGWRQEKNFISVYDGNQIQYMKLMEEKYGPLGQIEADRQKPATIFSANYKQHLRAVEYAFPNQYVSAVNIGFIGKGELISGVNTEWRIENYPKLFHQAILVDSFNVPVTNLFMIPKLVIDQADTWAKLRFDDKNAIAVLTKNDVDIYLVVEKNNKNFNLLKNQRGPLSIQLMNGQGEKLELSAYLLSNYSEIEKEKLSKNGFFILVRKPILVGVN